jgi:hypothetical protein
MSRSVSVAGVLAGCAALQAFVHGSNAVSPEARTVQQAAAGVAASVERSQALFGEKAAAISELRALANECGSDGWDGVEAKALDPVAVLMAEAFVRSVPAGVGMPEFAPEPDGAVSLDWIASQNRLFTVSVGTTARLAYAWLDGTDRGHGVAKFNGFTVPGRILEGIRSIQDHGGTALRIA